MVYLYVISFVAAVVMALVLTPVVKMFAVWVGAVDAPNHRKVHTHIMPRLGGLAIFISFIASFFIIAPVLDNYKENAAFSIVLGGAIIVLVGALDDRFQLSAKWKLLGQIVAACIVVFGFNLRVDILNIPFLEVSTNISDWLSVVITLFWIVGVTNAINLIDGLDGLAGGVSAIATATILVLALFMGNITVILLSTILLGSIIGFLFFNFHPAKIFMGDSGALFLGFALATLSILGFKQATLVSFVAPILMLGVPIADTFFAIIRRIINREPISVADKSHLHHCIHLQLGLSHRMTVLVIYGVAMIFGTTAVLLSLWDIALWLQIVVVAIILLVLELAAEAIGIISIGKKPVLHFLRRLQIKTARFLGTRMMK